MNLPRVLLALVPALALAAPLQAANATVIGIETCGTTSSSSANWSAFVGQNLCVSATYDDAAVPVVTTGATTIFDAANFEFVLDGTTTWTADAGRVVQNETGIGSDDLFLIDSVTPSGSPSPITGPTLSGTAVTSGFIVVDLIDALITDEAVLPSAIGLGDITAFIGGLRGANNSFLFFTQPASFSTTAQTTQTTSIVEPGTLALFGFGLLCLAATRRRKPNR